MISLHLKNPDTPIHSDILTEEELISVVRTYSGENLSTLEDSIKWLHYQEAYVLKVEPVTYEQLGKAHPGKTIGFCMGYMQFLTKIEAVGIKVEEEKIYRAKADARILLEQIRDRVLNTEAVCLVRSRGSYFLYYIEDILEVGQKDNVLFIRVKTSFIVVTNTDDDNCSRTSISLFKPKVRRLFLDESLTLSTLEQYGKLEAIANALEDTLMNP